MISIPGWGTKIPQAMWHSKQKKKRNFEKNHNNNTWRLNNMLINNQWLTEEIKEEVKENTQKQMKMKTQLSKIYEMHGKQFYRGKFIAIQACLWT